MSRFYRQIVIAILLLFLVMGMISPAQAKSETEGGGYWLPNDKEKIEKATELMQQGKSIGELGIMQDQIQKKEGIQTLDELMKEDQQSNATYKANMAPPIKTAAGWTPPEFDYDHILTTEECQRSPDSSSETGYIKNRYSFCWSHVATYQVPVKCIGGFCFNEGVQFQFTEIGYGSNQSRKMRVYYTLDDIIVTHPSLNGAKLKIDMMCESKLNAGDCKEDPDYPATERTIAQWKNTNFSTEIFTSEAPPSTDSNPDQLGYMEFWPKLTLTHAPRKFKKSIDGIKQTVRYDSAKYMFAFPNQYFWQGAVFSKATPIFNVPITKPEFSMLAEAGQHWKFAMDHPEQTKPQMIGKKIPGEVGDSTLTRMYTKRHPDEYNRNRSKTRSTCEREFRDEDRTGKDCDEYPFASTWQGSSTNGSDNFSVSLISSDSNQAAGTWLGTWYAYDRILDGDRFHVQVEAPEKIATIRSEGQPQDGQDHRSSDNFSIQNIPSYATKLQWKIVDGPTDAKFDVMKDINLGIDETIFYDLQDGSETEIETSGDLYIANPENTNGESFTVEVYAIP
ncbi:deoxyribonuclease NucA/NucB [Cytobacillus oceanisediminis]|uniref:Deoxyribonuclease NucA/NucB n=1 Tax=Cytobacillus oceanisediminis TaxID=665099 RepID=A0A2V3A5Y8_9BACI|nr:NucA/NucB deoxyribonuclease domain-containing protein [Cytobacillus oceanisediminis]PWW32423.1 deoxyribonuclease NucA/NucB [Cytobacillus oceanisediminis]